MGMPTFGASDLEQLVESVLSKVVEEFEHHIARQIELKKANFKDSSISYGDKSLLKTTSSSMKMEQKKLTSLKKDDMIQTNKIRDEESESKFAKQKVIVDQQQEDIKIMKILGQESAMRSDLNLGCPQEYWEECRKAEKWRDLSWLRSTGCYSAASSPASKRTENFIWCCCTFVLLVLLFVILLVVYEIF